MSARGGIRGAAVAKADRSQFLSNSARESVLLVREDRVGEWPCGGHRHPRAIATGAAWSKPTTP
jgi:hypothetical protein